LNLTINIKVKITNFISTDIIVEKDIIV